MDIQDLKRWHWVVIGIVLGAILAGARMMVEPDETNTADTRISAETFAYGLGQTTGGKQNLPLFRNIIVYPTQNDLDYVTAEQLMPIPGKRTYQYKVVSFHGTRPFRAGGGNIPSVRDFIERAAKTNSHVTYRFAWWMLPNFILLIWIGGGALVVGGIWPTVLNVMIGAGWGRSKKEKETFDLSRFKGEEAADAEKKVLTQADVDQLRALQAQLEENLKPTGAGNAVAEVTQSEEPVRQLSSGPVETVAVAREEEKNDYAGEFYPVARPHVPHAKKDE
ncbi:MAG TPA: hypothetical protein VL282_06380 [Tepidisphaeraceae bacterium]|nr:hypothetical protein [Tepidisphaeraceae bacterium]